MHNCLITVLCGACVFVVGLLVVIAVVAALWVPPEYWASLDTPCSAFPEHSVVFAPAFLNLGPVPGQSKLDECNRNPKLAELFRPGNANRKIAEKLQECSGRIDSVFTQKAVSDWLPDPNHLDDGTPVYQMHVHDPKVDVHTTEAFQCGLARLGDKVPDTIVLFGQANHEVRARWDLERVYGGKIVVVPGPTDLHAPGLMAFPKWALTNARGWTLDLGPAPICRAAVRCPPL